MCPLNICCSQFGFCGTTADFCGQGCQSNCHDPDRPSPVGGSVRNRIIGYYESWRAEGARCGTMRPEEIPVEYLDQVNVAFVYIDPVRYKIIDMDQPTTKDLYDRIADIKTRNPRAKLWVSVGGWTFNDPGPFQSVFTNLAEKFWLSYTFAESLMEFMDRFGFDGVDLDWEYPGADDRGGKPEDVKNFPNMLGILKKKLQGGNKYSKHFGISITVPTSYWYLRWFDLKALEAVVDDFNLMAYDLHGTWDELNPIGPYVYAHTNLTEIEMALDLFWRNDINPNKIILGLAFYGRSYKLQTPLCAEPGCEWKDPGAKGKCTDAAGILSYSEIQDLIEESDLRPQYDEDAGVYYIQYGDGGGNWASFDDEISFQAKINLANKYGLGGLLIWAIDQDDPNHHALQAVTGTTVISPPQAVAGFGAFSLDQCYTTDCGKSCDEGDVTMTQLATKEAVSCDRDKKSGTRKMRSYCCPALNSPDPGTCYWRGANSSDSCSGQCDVGDVLMTIDGYGPDPKSNKYCGSMRIIYCCPATNGQDVIAKCGWGEPGKACPKDKPRELTSKRELTSTDTDSRHYEDAKFCCPEKPDFENCAWHGDSGWVCSGSSCPIGKVALTATKEPHNGPVKSSPGCMFGRNSNFCCDPPLTGGSAFLPVPLENLFPDAENFPDSYNPTFAVGFDTDSDETTSEIPGSDPDEKAFAWVVMVGDEEDVHSFDKRDGSDLELFDCSNPHKEDFSLQFARAICTGGETNNCEDITKGGVEGTVVRMPASCGSDGYVRAVRFERSSNATLPGHLQRRYPDPGVNHVVYDFYYDYNFRSLRRDGGEIYFRADLSTHPGYWDSIVAAPVKRDATTWRELDRRWLAELSPKAWYNHFQSIFGANMGDLEKTGLVKSYGFNKCLFQASAVCAGTPTYKAEAESYVYGQLNTTMDMGMTLIGTLRNFGFSEAFASFTQQEMSVRVGASLRAKAQLYFDSGWHPLGPFDAFGMGMNLKGIFSINPYFSLDARIEADAYVSAQATFEMNFHHNALRYYLPWDLGTSITQPLGDWGLDGLPGPIIGNGEIEARVGGGLVYHIRPTIGIDVKLQVADHQYTDTSIKLTSDSQMRVDIALSTKCPEGLQIDISGGMHIHLGVENALVSSWKGSNGDLLFMTPRRIFSACVPFSALVVRELEGRGSMSYLSKRAPEIPELDPIPDDTDPVCAVDLGSGTFCADKDGHNDPDLDCDLRAKSDRQYSWPPDWLNEGDSGDDDEDDNGQPPKGIKLSSKSADYCDKKGGGDSVGFLNGNRGTIQFTKYPSSGNLVKIRPDVTTYEAEDLLDCKNLNLAQLKRTPKQPSLLPKNGGRKYDTEHLLEAQTVGRFFNAMGQRWSNKGKQTSNADAKIFENPSPGQTDKVPWCRYMRLWWDPRAAWKANVELGSVYPGKDQYTEEWILYESTLNSGVKQNWFGDKAAYHTDKIQTYIDARDWSEVAKIIKLEILGWKYYYYQDNIKGLVKQAKRIEKKLAELEGTGDNSINKKSIGLLFPAYKSQDLSTHWRTFVEEEHSRVQAQTKAWLLKWAQKVYLLNRPAPKDGEQPPKGNGIQRNKQIVEVFETIWDEVKVLKNWEIDWDKDYDADEDAE
ncbi:hypothetical protein BDW59DRAFT_167530 [Aspergillus cavernicola]|uniref:chitinase n=1 Tax=Aspergillus cavernicola TaxID=176166 RepID=A0ABR4HD77_9EURO